jgi:two-component system, NtrC family, sensor histidine kinase KinB
LRLQTKLLLAAAPLALGLALVGFVSLRAFDDLGRSAQRILQDNYRSVLAAQRMKEAAERIDGAAAFRAVGRPDKAELQAAPNIKTFDDELAIQEHNLTEPGEEQATRQVRSLWSEYSGKYRLFALLTDEGDLRRRYFEDMEPSALRLKEAANRVLEINQDAMVRKSEEARRSAARARSRLLFAAVCALALGVFASVSLTRRMLRPLEVLSMAVRRIGEGDLEARARLTGGDEIAEVGREVDLLADKIREYRSSSLGELLQAQQSSQAAIDSLPDPVLVLAVDGTVLNVNQAAETVLKISAGADPLAQMPAELRAAVERVRAYVVAGKGAWVPKGLEEAVRTTAAGGDRALLPRATPLYSETGGVMGATIVLQDVTRLLRFDELKNDLVATVAHEFRTPLTSLQMALHVLIEGLLGQLNDRQVEMLITARDDCQRLQGIVEDLLDLSRIQAGKVEMSLTPLPAKSILDAAVAAKEQSAVDASVRLEEVVGEPVLPVLVDAERITLVFDNLIANAIRHSPRGGLIDVRALPEGPRVRFEVQDQGPGIPPEYRQRIFEKFFRIPGTKGEGVGLGLFISREIVLAHGGEMGVETDVGKGSRFWFTLRVAPAIALAAEQAFMTSLRATPRP